MEELQALQKKLMEIQKSGGGFKLSERTVVDIIQKVMSRGKIKLIHTTNGKEYVAEEKITKEILDEIKRNQGRISKLELVKLLEVPSNIVESKVSQLLSRDKSLNLIEGNIITNYYIENVCNEINEMLKVNGCVFLSDMATRFDLSIDFFKRFLKERVGSFVNAKLYETRLLTSDYVETQKQRIRPVLIASTTPIQISYIVNNYQIDELIIEDLIKNLIDSGIVKGKLSCNTYEPAVYSQSQASYVKGALLQNHFIEYSKLKNIGITKNAKDYIKDLQNKDSSLIDGLFLKEFFIDSQLKNNFEYVFFDNLSKNYSTNLSSIFNFELQDEDINSLLESVNIKLNTVYSLNMNVAPIAVIDNYIQTISPKLKEEASKQYNNFIAKIKEREKKKAEGEKDSSKKKVKAKGKQKSKGKNEDDEEEESAENYITLTPTFKKELETLFFKLSNFEDMNDKEETLNELFEKHSLLKIIQMYTQYITEFIKSKSQNVNDPKNLMSQIENDFLEMKFTQKSLETLMKASTDPNYQSSIKAVIAHLCKKDLTNLFKNILTYQLIHMKSKIDINKINDPNQRKEIISSIVDDDFKEIFLSLNDSLHNKNFIQFMKTLEESAKILAVSLSLWDKKKEKALTEKYSGEWMNSIDEKLTMLGKTNKKEYIALAVDICQSALLKKGTFLKLPYESWAIGIYANILPELKSLLMELSELFNISEEDFFTKQDEVSDLLKKLFNSY